MTTQIATKTFDYAIADWSLTVSLSNFNHPTGVVNRFTGPIFQIRETMEASSSLMAEWVPTNNRGTTRVALKVEELSRLEGKQLSLIS